MAESEEEINNVHEGKEENEFKNLDCGFRSCTGQWRVGGHFVFAI